ncbi:MAG: copper amine oxidase [Peptococcaceae bacterium BRH_c8a]|nr:MAG: copper amine oxidase [Peptococcaceae bacterium BRH_c8a]
MKRLLLTVITMATILLAGILNPALAQEQNSSIPVLIDGFPIIMDTPPVIQDGRTMVPFRALAEALGVNVTWDGTAQTVRATDGNRSIKLQIGSHTAYRNEAPVTLDAPPLITGGRTLIPLRFFSEAFDCQVAWDGSVKITSPPREMFITGFYALGDPGTSSWTNLFGVQYPATGQGKTGLVSELALGWYSLDEAGNLLTKSKQNWQRPEGWEDVLKAAGQHHLKTEMVVQLADGDGTLTELLTSDPAVQNSISAIVAEATIYEGVNLDFEGLGYSQTGAELEAVRESFNSYVSRLAKQLHAAGKSLSLSLHPPNSSFKGYDYQALGQHADRVIIMAYDYGTKPEPINLVTQAVEMAAAVVPPAKLSLGISIPSETVESLSAKLGIAKRYNLGGISLWRLGLLSEQMWDTLETAVQTK